MVKEIQVSQTHTPEMFLSHKTGQIARYLWNNGIYVSIQNLIPKWQWLQQAISNSWKNNTIVSSFMLLVMERESSLQ